MSTLAANVDFWCTRNVRNLDLLEWSSESRAGCDDTSFSFTCTLVCQNSLHVRCNMLKEINPNWGGCTELQPGVHSATLRFASVRVSALRPTEWPSVCETSRVRVSDYWNIGT